MVHKQHCCIIADISMSNIPLFLNKNQQSYAQLKKVLYHQIQLLIQLQNISCFMVCMGFGLEKICAELILDMKKVYPYIQLECVLPYESYFSSFANSQMFHHSSILKNQFYSIVEKSSHILAIWDGNNYNFTSQILRYGRIFQKHFIIIHPTSYEIIEEYPSSYR